MPLMLSSLTAKWIKAEQKGREDARVRGGHSMQDFQRGVKADIYCCLIVGTFTIFGPILSFGWPFLSFHNIAIFLAVYTLTQNLPNFFTMGLFDVVSGPFQLFTEYCKPCTFVMNAQLDPEKTYVIGWHPHGRVFIGIGVFLGQMLAWLPQFRASSRMVHVAINDAMFMLPFIGTWLQLLGMIPVNKHVIRAVLARGDSVTIAVGGIEEVLLETCDEIDYLYLAHRKGFVKLAMESGAGLVPVFCFGENLLFRHSSPRSLAFWHAINKYIKLGAPFPIQGRWGLPLAFRRPLHIVWGEALFAREGETLHELHARYVAALQALYAAHVGETADPHRRLVIV